MESAAALIDPTLTLSPLKWYVVTRTIPVRLCDKIKMVNIRSVTLTGNVVICVMTATLVVIEGCGPLGKLDYFRVVLT